MVNTGGRWSLGKSENEDKNKRKQLMLSVNMNEIRKYFYPHNVNRIYDIVIITPETAILVSIVSCT